MSKLSLKEEIRYHIDTNILQQRLIKKLDEFYVAKLTEKRKEIAELNENIFNCKEKIDELNLRIVRILGVSGLDNKEAREEYINLWLKSN